MLFLLSALWLLRFALLWRSLATQRRGGPKGGPLSCWENLSEKYDGLKSIRSDPVSPAVNHSTRRERKSDGKTGKDGKRTILENDPSTG